SARCFRSFSATSRQRALCSSRRVRRRARPLATCTARTCSTRASIPTNTARCLLLPDSACWTSHRKTRNAAGTPSGSRKRKASAMPVDFGKTASDYAKHRAGFPDRFFDRLFKDGIVAKGARVLDLGTGTGTVARGLAKRHCRVTALDPSEPMLDQAKALADEE